MSTKAFDMMQAGQEAIKNAQANTGAGFQGEWPPEGTWGAYLVGVSEPTVTTFRMGRNDYNGENGNPKIECVSLHFFYKEDFDLNDNGTDAEAPTRQPVSWDGKDFQLIFDENALALLPENYQKAARMDMERFKGHVLKILNLPSDTNFNPKEAFAQIKEAVASAPIPLMVRCDYYTPEGKSTSYKTDFIRENLG